MAINLPFLTRADTDANLFSNVKDNDQAIVDYVNGNIVNADVSASADISGAKLAAGSVTAFRLSITDVLDPTGITNAGTTRRDTATVATEQTTTSTTWADLATVGPSVTITVPSNALVLVGVQVEYQGTGGNIATVGVSEATNYALSGVPEQDVSHTNERRLVTTNTAYTSLPSTASFILPATAGSRTYTLKYAVTAGTGTFKNRTIWALALGGF